MTPLTLITIPISHFCEKARWALDLGHLPFVEDGHLPMFHTMHTRRRGGRSTPVLVTPELTLRDSTDILLWVDARHPGLLYPTDPTLRQEVLSLEDRFDLQLGPHLRRVGYFHLLPHKRVALSIIAQRAPRWELAAVGPLYPLVRKIMQRGLKITPAGAARSTEKVRALFAEVSALLADPQRRYLVGDTFTAADLTFAALAAPLLFPPEHPIRWPAAPDRPASLAALSDELIATPAGQFALRLYRDHRIANPGPHETTRPSEA